MEGETQQEGQPDVWSLVVDDYTTRYSTLESEVFNGRMDSFEYYKELTLPFLNRFRSHMPPEDEGHIIEFKNLLLQYNQTYPNPLEGFIELRKFHNIFMKILRDIRVDKVLQIVAPVI